MRWTQLSQLGSLVKLTKCPSLYCYISFLKEWTNIYLGAKVLLFKNKIFHGVRKSKVKSEPYSHPRHPIFKTRVIYLALQLTEDKPFLKHTLRVFPEQVTKSSYFIHSASLSKCNIAPWGASSPIPQLVFIHTRNFNSVLGLTKWELCLHKATTTSQFTESNELSQFTGGDTNCQTGYLVPYRPNNA